MTVSSLWRKVATMSSTADDVHVRDGDVSLEQNMIHGDVSAPQSHNEHHPDHVHNNSYVEKGREDGAIYSHGTTFKESTFLHQDPQDHDLHRRRQSDPANETAAAVDPAQSMFYSNAEGHSQIHIFSRSYKRNRIIFHLLIGVVFTGWWIAGLILHGIHDPLSSNTGWLKPFLLWLGITSRIVFFYFPVNVLVKPIRWAWGATSARFTELLPNRVRVPLAALLTVSVFLIVGFVSPESEDNTRDNRAVCTYTWSL